MLDNLKNYKIILASNSPRRKELLKRVGLNFEVKTIKDVDESFPSSLEFSHVAEFIATKKADSYSSIINKESNVLVITADTIVCNNNILGKPKDKKEALEMLKDLSGKTHSVYTGVCVFTKLQRISFTSETKVTFDKLDDKQINYYIDNFEPYDKAGSYGIQEWIGLVGIKGINGSFYNVMGLPICKLMNELKKIKNG